MKKVALSIVIIFSCVATFAQEHSSKMIPGSKGLFFKRHFIEVRASYGKWTAPDVVDAIGESVFNGTDIGAALGSFDITGGGVYGGSLILFPDNRLSIGADFLINTNQSIVSSSAPGPPTRSFDMKYTSVLGRVDYHYINLHHFKLYGSTAIGATWKSASNGSEVDKKTGFAYQITPIGVAVGGMIAGWAELGFGYRGILSAGVAVRF